MLTKEQGGQCEINWVGERIVGNEVKEVVEADVTDLEGHCNNWFLLRKGGKHRMRLLLC